MVNKSEYLAIMDFINSRKHQNNDESANKYRRKQYQKNLAVMTLLHGLGYFIVAAFFAFPIIDFVVNNSYRSPQPLYIPIDFALHSWTLYGIIYVFICFAIHNSGVLVITTCLFHNSIAEFLTTELRILGISLEKASDGENTSENYKNLIKHHQDILRLNEKCLANFENFNNFFLESRKHSRNFYRFLFSAKLSRPESF